MTINHLLASNGICQLDPLFSAEEIAHINRVADPLFTTRAHEARAYIYADEIGSLGLLPLVLSPRMRDCLFAIIPDAVLYHMHIYEIAANQSEPHIFSDVMRGWHRDPDSENGRREATHVSLFVYLTDVAAENGPFEFIPQHPLTLLHQNTPYASMVGNAGYSFAWNRSFYHRAAANRSPVRRRLLKISIQNNRYISDHLGNDHFRALIAATPAGDPALDLLLGRNQGSTAPLQQPAHRPAFQPITPQHTLGLSNHYLLKWQARLLSRAIKGRLRQRTASKAAAYD